MWNAGEENFVEKLPQGIVNSFDVIHGHHDDICKETVVFLAYFGTTTIAIINPLGYILGHKSR